MKPAWISFDCYGTLIDWERGIQGYLVPLLEKKGVRRPIRELIDLWEPIQFQMIQRPWQNYRTILFQSLYETFLRLGIPWAPSDSIGFGDAMATWRPFPEVPGALKRLKKIAKLAIISNTDNDIIAKTAPMLGVPFDLVVTAESLKSYKPSPENFEAALKRMGAAPDDVLHASGFFEYDLGPARELGLQTCYVNRSGRPAPVSTDYHVRDLEGLADDLGV